MRLFDTHCHIADPRFDADRAEVVARFLEAGVLRALVVADPREAIYDGPEDEGGKLIAVGNQEKVFALVDEYPFLYGAVGVHPHNASDLVEYAMTEWPKERLRGVMTSMWKPTIEENRECCIDGIRLFGEALKKYGF